MSKFKFQEKINNLISSVFKADVSADATEVETYDALEKAVNGMAANAAKADDLQTDLNTANSNFENLNGEFTTMKESFKALNDSFNELSEKINSKNYDDIIEEKLTVTRTQFAQEIAALKTGVKNTDTGKTIEEKAKEGAKDSVEFPGNDWNAKTVKVSTNK